ncbi:MAG: peptidoglycan DD-metalloendopeptidase family protein [Bacteroidetes bacterium]|nr:peptidoglycan DD-metalloendopeptidase family protein [Bacteroidota bacterium]
MFKRIFLIVFFVARLLANSYAQQGTREDLQKKEKDLLKELADLNNMLTQTQKTKKLSLNQLAIIKKKIHQREDLVNTINKQVHQLDETIFNNERDIYRLGKELDTLKLKYAKSIMFAYKNRSSYEYLNFLFSANDFNDAVKRITYLKSYRQNRETQVSTILKSEDLLKDKIGTLSNNKKEMGKTLVKQSEQLKDLQQDKKEQDQIVSQLKLKEREIGQQIRDKEKQRQKMQQAVMAIIRRETEEADRRAKIAKQKAIDDDKKKQAAPKVTAADNSVKTAAPAPNTRPKLSGESVTGVASPSKESDRTYTALESTPAGRETSIKFENNKGRLPWPVDAGMVTIRFGTENMPGTKLMQKSDGVEIALAPGTAVKSVADGSISYAGDIGGEQVVFVRHGKYFTSYSHLSSINVSVGQEVKAGSVLGKSGNGLDGEGAVLFMVNNEKGTPLNPESWLKPRR